MFTILVETPTWTDKELYLDDSYNNSYNKLVPFMFKILVETPTWTDIEVYGDDSYNNSYRVRCKSLAPFLRLRR